MPHTMNKAARNELHDFLTAARARCRPEEFGIIPARSRRRPGLHQRDVADLLGVSERWYNALENGTFHGTPAEDLLNRLAAILRLREAERLRLHLLVTGREPATPGTSLPEPTEVSAVFRMTELLGPDLPGFLCDIAWNVQAWNSAMARRVGNLPGLPPAERNAVTWLFSPGAGERFRNLQEVRTSRLAQVHLALARHRDEPRLGHLVRRLMQIPEARKIWMEQQVGDENPDISRRLVLHDGVAADVDLVTLDCPGHLRLLVYVPREGWPEGT